MKKIKIVAVKKLNPKLYTEKERVARDRSGRKARMTGYAGRGYYYFHHEDYVIS